MSGIHIVRKRLNGIRPSPENDLIYNPTKRDDPELQALAKSIKKHGMQEPIVITKDRYIVSGHRRYAAASMIGQTTVPCRVLNFKRTDDPDKFVTHLREYNRQRDKTNAEKLREELVNFDPTQAYRSLIEHRTIWAEDSIPNAVNIEGNKRRAIITDVKDQMVAAIVKVFEERMDYLPISVRAVHYALLNHRFLKNTNKKDSWYINDRPSYQNLSELLTRMRINGMIPWKWMTDDTRPMAIWRSWPNCRQFCRDQLNGFLKGYWRDLMQSQPRHVEVIAEKNTVFGMLKSVTQQYCIPTMSGRGFSGIDPYHTMAQRYERSGKDGLVVVVASDFDPEGLEIVQVAGRTLRDDFGVSDVEIIHCAVTEEQIEEHNLPADNEAKITSSRYQKFVDRHGEAVYELEALPPDVLTGELTKAIDSVIDRDAFDEELDAEQEDATFLEGVRKQVHRAMQGIDFESEHSGQD